MDKDLRSLLESGIKECGIQVPADRLEKLYDEISLFNPVYKLVAAEGKDLVTRHILDCLAPVSIIRGFVKYGDRGADLGSGSGLPGLVLASALPSVHFTLVERMGRRAGFLRNTSALCGLKDNTEVLERDLSEVKEVFDFVVFRAFRPLEEIIADVKRITHENSFVFIYKSSEENTEKEKKVAEKDFECTTVDYTVPYLEAKRTLLILRRKKDA